MLRPRWLTSLVAAAGLVLAVVVGAMPTASGPTGVANSSGVQTASEDPSLFAAPPAHSGHLVAKPTKRLPWGPAEPVRWTAVLLTVLTVVTFSMLAAARRALRWCAFVLRAPPVSAVG